MMNKIGRALRYWFGAIFRPGWVIDQFSVDPDRLAISLWILLLFGLAYALTALLLYLGGAQPAIEPWMPIANERYYLYQPLWTVPWGLGTALMMAAVAHVMGVIGRRGGGAFSFEDALVVNTVAWVVPSFVLMWLPETLVAPLFGGAAWPSWVEVLRLSVLAPVWQAALTLMGMRKTHNVGWVRGIIIAVTVTGVGFLMFLPFMR